MLLFYNILYVLNKSNSGEKIRVLLPQDYHDFQILYPEDLIRSRRSYKDYLRSHFTSTIILHRDNYLIELAFALMNRRLQLRDAQLKRDPQNSLSIFNLCLFSKEIGGTTPQSQISKNPGQKNRPGGLQIMNNS